MSFPRLGQKRQYTFCMAISFAACTLGDLSFCMRSSATWSYHAWETMRTDHCKLEMHEGPRCPAILHTGPQSLRGVERSWPHSALPTLQMCELNKWSWLLQPLSFGVLCYCLMRNQNNQINLQIYLLTFISPWQHTFHAWPSHMFLCLKIATSTNMPACKALLCFQEPLQVVLVVAFSHCYSLLSF